MSFILTASHPEGETLTFQVDTIEDAEHVKRAVAHLNWQISAMPVDNTDREIARRAVHLEHWQLVATEIVKTDMRLMFEGTAGQAEREALAENIFIAMAQAGSWYPVAMAERAFTYADAFIAKRNEERSK